MCMYNKTMSLPKNFIRHIPLVIGVFVLLALGYGMYYYRDSSINLSSALSEKQNELETVTLDLNREISGLRENLAQVQAENLNLSEQLVIEQGKNAMFAKEIAGIAGTVGLLEKISKTDKELLQKYSKIYFLNEHYIPESLAQITKKYLAVGNDEEWFHARVWPRLQTMLDAASRDGITLQVVSGYRSFDTQRELKYGYRVTYGSGANQFSADQGYSEHQLGTTVDLTTPAMGSSLTTQFEKMSEYAWLQANAHRYGFILSYPKGNIYYQFEPWHWRYVGVSLATKLHNEEKYFYDLDQREIDVYLASFFD